MIHRQKWFSKLMSALILCACSKMAMAATIEVTAQVGQPGCDLVDAIDAANSNSAVGGCEAGSSERDTIILNFSVRINEFVINSVNNNSATGDNGLPEIMSNIRILAPSREPVVIKRSDAAGTPDFRLFSVVSGGRLELENISVQNGKLPQDTLGGGLSLSDLLN